MELISVDGTSASMRLGNEETAEEEALEGVAAAEVTGGASPIVLCAP